MTAAAVPLTLRIGARTLARVSRRLHRVALSLADAQAGRVPLLPPLGDAQGWLVTSLPADRLPALRQARPETLALVRDRYTRRWADLTLGWEGYRAALSPNARATITRKAKRLTASAAWEVRSYRTPDELAAFHPLARAVSARTYQEALLDAGLPDDAAFRSAMLADAAADRVRAWLLFVDGRAAAYLYCPAAGDTLIYAHVGHDPALAALSPGAVLMAEALRSLAGDRFARFDFTEGDGQHKRQFATGGVACVDLLLLRRTPANRLLVLTLAGFDRGVSLAKRVLSAPGLARLVRRLRR